MGGEKIRASAHVRELFSEEREIRNKVAPRDPEPRDLHERSPIFSGSTIRECNIPESRTATNKARR